MTPYGLRFYRKQPKPRPKVLSNALKNGARRDSKSPHFKVRNVDRPSGTQSCPPDPSKVRDTQGVIYPHSLHFRRKFHVQWQSNQKMQIGASTCGGASRGKTLIPVSSTEERTRYELSHATTGDLCGINSCAADLCGRPQRAVLLTEALCSPRSSLPASEPSMPPL